MLQIIENIASWLKYIITSLGYTGIAAGMLLESACFPLPSELVLPMGGMMAAGGGITLLGANIAAAAGSLLGSLAAYAAGRYGGRYFICKYGKYFLISIRHFKKAEETFNRYGAAAVFFGRLFPVIRTFISLPAGIAEMKPGKFLFYSIIGILPWNFLLIFLGFKFRKNYEIVIRPLFHRFEYIVTGLVLFVLLLFVLKSFFIAKRAGRGS